MTSLLHTRQRTRSIVSREEFPAMLQALQARGYEIIGPTLRDGVIALDQIDSVADLPAGWRDRQSAGVYRLEKEADGAIFSHTVGPDAWKRFLYPPNVRLWQAERTEDGFTIIEESEEQPRYAFLGVRACDLRAIRLQDRIFLRGRYVDPIYKQRRAEAFVIAVNCTRAGATCFCVSMAGGPLVTNDFDLALTEIIDDNRHYFVVETGSDRGADLLADLPHQIATASEVEEAECAVAAVTSHMGRTLETEDLPDLFAETLEHPHWDDVASRCLSCGNCTMVCPTCFCSTVEDSTSLSGERAERRRLADSCFSVEFSHISGGSVRASSKSRYRQWLTHKLSAWVDQFGTFGCVGCGRCITWCPVGIDLIDEVESLRIQAKQSAEN